MTDWLLEKLGAITREVSAKLWTIGKFLAPLYAAIEGIFWLFGDKIKNATIAFKDDLTEIFQNLEIDLTVPAEYAAKINSFIPLYEGVQLLLAYFAIVLVLTGFKWIRNLIPGMS